MNAGRLKKRATLYEPSETTATAYGEMVPTWTAKATVWAEVLPQSGRWFEAAAKQWEEHTHRIRIRYRSDVRATWRVHLGTRVLEILSTVHPEEYGAELILICKEIIE